MLWNQRLTLNRLFLRIALLGTAALFIAGALLVSHERTKLFKQWQTDTISKSASLTSSYYSTLNTKLLLGQTSAVGRILEGLKKEEKLMSATIASPEQLDRPVLETCKLDYTQAYFLQVPTCYEVVGSTLKIYHELRSAGYSMGYLLKEVEVKTPSILGTLLMFRHVGYVLLVYLIEVMLVLYCIKKYLIRPLHDVTETLRDPNRLMGDEINTKVDELRTIYESLRQSIQSVADYERKIQQYEYDAKLAQISTQVAHDIRSPLSSMQSALMLLRQHCSGDKDAAEFLNLLQLSSTRLEGISNGLLAKYKGEEAGAQTFSIHEVLDELIGELRASPIGQGTEFIKHYHSNALYMSGDKTGISRAIGNIIKNALEAMQKNPAERPRQLTVSTIILPSPQSPPIKGGDAGEVTLKITDTGPGIPADKIPLILQGGHTEGKEDGHGIGTKVVREVIDAHKGVLDIESEVGKGTTFEITLPLTPPLEGGESEMTVSIPYSGATPICVIDDEPSMREQWRLTLKALGADVETYTCWEDSESARHPGRRAGGQNELQSGCRLEGQHNDVFIVDYHFDNSEVDGIEIIRRLKARGFTNFILATAEYWKPAIKDAAKELNITLCPKPLPKVVLANAPLPWGEGHLSARSLAEGEGEMQVSSPSSAPASNAGAPSPEGEGRGPSVLLIDDDEAIRMTWKAVKKILGVDKLTTYSNLEEMIAAATNPADYDMCVIDKNIQGSQYNGAKMLAHLKENGAKKVFLATGEGRRQIEQDPAFASIDGIITEKIPMSLEKYLN